MKRILLSMVAVAGLITVGCSKEDEELPATGSGSVAAVDPLAIGSGPTPDAPAAPPDPATALRPPETMIDFSAAERPTDNDGKAMDDLALLNNLVFNINEGRTTYVSDYTPDFKNDAERQAYETALAKAREPLKDINELVRLKVIKALPAAPAGKRFAINATSGKVELVSQ